MDYSNFVHNFYLPYVSMDMVFSLLLLSFYSSLVTDFSPPEQPIGRKVCIMIRHSLLCVFSHFRGNTQGSSNARPKKREGQKPIWPRLSQKQ